MLNHIDVMGRLVRDPELRYTQSNTPVTSFTIAVDRDFGKTESGDRQTDFIDVVAWRSTAEFVTRYFRKGQLVAVSGRLQTRKWQDNQGNNRTAYEVVADEVFFAESRRDSSGGADYQPSGPSSYAPPAAQEAPRAEAPKPSTSAYDDFSDDDELPF